MWDRRLKGAWDVGVTPEELVRAEAYEDLIRGKKLPKVPSCWENPDGPC